MKPKKRNLLIFLVSIVILAVTACSSEQVFEPNALAGRDDTVRQTALQAITPDLDVNAPDRPPREEKLKLPNGTIAIDIPSSTIGDVFTALEMKILVIASRADDYGLGALEALLNNVGVPYDVLLASEEELTLDKLVMSNGTGRYQGVFLADNALSYSPDGGATWLSYFDASEWNLLWQYERDFGVRQVTMYAFPQAADGMEFVGAVSTMETPLTTTMTTEGKAVFKSLKDNTAIPIRYAYTYQAKLNTTGGVQSATPLLTDPSGNVLAVQSKTADGREQIVLTFAHNSSVLHSQLLSYDLLRWVTNGTFIGERRYYLSLDVDDWYLESDVWNPQTLKNYTYEERTFRLNATDVYNAKDGVLDLRSRFNIPNLNYNQVFNAQGADPLATASCRNNATLSQATLCVGDFFPWVSHTWDHSEMDFLDYADSREQFEKNNVFGQANLPGYNKNFLVTGKHSGLGWYRISDAPAGAVCKFDQVQGDPYCQYGLEASNTVMLKAAVDLGITYLAANRGWYSHEAKCETCLIVHPLEPQIKLIPRWPTNVFYNVTNPTENVSEFNFLYGPNGIVRDGNDNAFFSENQTWEQILDFEATIAMRHILTGSPYPHFVHQANLREYADGRSLLYDWTEATLKAYDKYLDLPLISQNWAQLTSTLEDRTSFYDAGVSGILYRKLGLIEVTAASKGEVYVTGATIGTDQFTYGSDSVSNIKLKAGVTVGGTIPWNTAGDGSNNTKPSIQAVRNQSGSRGASVSLQITASDSDGDTLTYLAAGLPTGLSINYQTGLISGTLSVKGKSNVIITVSDGKEPVTLKFTWNVK